VLSAPQGMPGQQPTGQPQTQTETLDGNIVGFPTACSPDGSRMDVFALGTDKAMWHKTWDGTKWKDWKTKDSPTGAAGGLKFSPSCVSWGPKRIDCFAVGNNDGVLYQKTYDNAWKDWASQGGNLADTPSCVSQAVNMLDCFARGIDNKLYQKSWNNGVMVFDWKGLGDNVIASAASCASMAQGKIDCFALGADGSIMQYNIGGAGGWSSLAGKFQDAPSAVSLGNNQMEVWAHEADGTVKRKAFNAAWGDWAAVGVQSLKGLGLLKRPNTATVDYFTVSTSGVLIHGAITPVNPAGAAPNPQGQIQPMR